MRTCVRVSIRGGSYRWFQAALERGDLAGVRAAAAELGNTVNLVDALAVVLLMARDGDPAFSRAAARWAARLVLDRPSMALADIRIAVDALDLLPRDPPP